MRFTDASILSIPIPISQIPTSSSVSCSPPILTSTSLSRSSTLVDGPKTAKLEGKKEMLKNGWLQRLKGEGKVKREDFRMVKMTRAEYLRFWAKDSEGRYVGTENEGDKEEFWAARR